MARNKLVKISNGDLTSEVLPETVPAWMSAGWTLVDDGSSESVPEEPPVDDPQGPEEPDDNMDEE
jgi:hypothetical protein